ncbi:hypothetical protein JHK86_000774 [Glycine max]|nr:hypothetical protein JHK86_000774 [Glycine max]
MSSWHDLNGVDKDTFFARLRDSYCTLHFLVDGKDYIFISKEEFLGMVEWEELLEYALVYGDYKGMLK